MIILVHVYVYMSVHVHVYIHIDMKACESLKYYNYDIFNEIYMYMYKIFM